jgi:hypothetical protein
MGRMESRGTRNCDILGTLEKQILRIVMFLRS